MKFVGTNINDALVAALGQLNSADRPDFAAPTVIFLTDGQPTVGVQNEDKIVGNVLASIKRILCN